MGEKDRAGAAWRGCEVGTARCGGEARAAWPRAEVGAARCGGEARTARRGCEAVKLVLGCAPFLACIGMVEGFISPGSLFPTWAKAALGLTLGGLFWAYLLRAGRDETVRTVATREAAG